jgi:hypothetical protein
MCNWTITILRTCEFIILKSNNKRFLTPSLTAFRRKNALHGIHDKTPKLKPVDLSPQTKHGLSIRVTGITSEEINNKSDLFRITIV